MTIPPSQITGLVLAGGRGRRMGGVDKGLQPYRGRPLAEQAVIRLAPQVASVWVSANRHLPAYAAFADQVCADAAADFTGPLAGILAGLVRCPTPYLAAVPCDCPAFPLDLVQRLAAALADAAADVATATVRSGDGWRAQPVFCLLKVELLPRLQQALARDERKVGGWMAQQQRVEVSFDDPGAFVNINTLLDLQRLA